MVWRAKNKHEADAVIRLVAKYGISVLYGLDELCTDNSSETSSAKLETKYDIFYSIPLHLRHKLIACPPRASTMSITADGEVSYEILCRHGVVDWFDEERGVGSIVSPQGENVFVHHRSILRSKDKCLERGQRVEYIQVQTRSGWQASDVVAMAA